jgi:hypothetical protein
MEKKKIVWSGLVILHIDYSTFPNADRSRPIFATKVFKSARHVLYRPQSSRPGRFWVSLSFSFLALLVRSLSSLFNLGSVFTFLSLVYP